MKKITLILLMITGSLSASETKILDSTTFDSVIKTGIVLVDFHAAWCGPCKKQGPVIDELAGKQTTVIVAKADIDDCKSAASVYQVYRIPCLVLFKDGKEVARKEGRRDLNELIAWLKEWETHP